MHKLTSDLSTAIQIHPHNDLLASYGVQVDSIDLIPKRPLWGCNVLSIRQEGEGARFASGRDTKSLWVGSSVLIPYLLGVSIMLSCFGDLKNESCILATGSLCPLISYMKTLNTHFPR